MSAVTFKPIQLNYPADIQSIPLKHWFIASALKSCELLTIGSRALVLKSEAGCIHSLVGSLVALL